LKGDLGEVLPKEETRDLLVQIQFARETLVQNEKIWLRIKKGREILGEFDTARLNKTIDS